MANNMPKKKIPSDEYLETVAHKTALASSAGAHAVSGSSQPVGHTSPPKTAPVNSPKYVSPQNFLDNVANRYQK